VVLGRELAHFAVGCLALDDPVRVGCVPARFGPHPVAFNGLRHGVHPKRHPEPGGCAVGVGAAEGRGVCLEVGAVGAEDCAILEPEPVAERELLDLREIACAAAELGGDPADRAWATSWKRSRSESSSWSAAPSFINALWKALTKSLSLRVRNSPRYVLTSSACAASAISSASRFSSS
jgi:hypothetical protein